MVLCVFFFFFRCSNDFVLKRLDSVMKTNPSIYSSSIIQRNKISPLMIMLKMHHDIKILWSSPHCFVNGGLFIHRKQNKLDEKSINFQPGETQGERHSLFVKFFSLFFLKSLFLIIFDSEVSNLKIIIKSGDVNLCYNNETLIL